MHVRIDDAICTAATDKAILVLIEGRQYWIPQSQIGVESEVWRKGDEGTLVINEWIAYVKGIA